MSWGFDPKLFKYLGTGYPEIYTMVFTSVKRRLKPEYVLICPACATFFL